MDMNVSVAARCAAVLLGGCVVAPTYPVDTRYPMPGTVYVEQGADGSPTYVDREVAAMSGVPPVVTGPDVRVAPAWPAYAYGGYGYAPYLYPPAPASSLFFSWGSGPVRRPYRHAYPGRPGGHPIRPPPAAVAVPRAVPPPPAVAAPRPSAPPAGYRGPYRGLMGARK
jgi:hypothetical protein